MSPNLSVPDVSSQLGASLTRTSQKRCWVLVASHQRALGFLIRPITGDIHIDRLINVVSARLFCCKVTLLPFVIIKYVVGRSFETIPFYSNFHFLYLFLLVWTRGLLFQRIIIHYYPGLF